MNIPEINHGTMLQALRESIERIENAAYRTQDWSGTPLETAIDDAKKLVGTYINYDDILNDPNAKKTGESFDFGGPYGEGYEG